MCTTYWVRTGLQVFHAAYFVNIVHILRLNTPYFRSPWSKIDVKINKWKQINHRNSPQNPLYHFDTTCNCYRRNLISCLMSRLSVVSNKTYTVMQVAHAYFALYHATVTPSQYHLKCCYLIGWEVKEEPLLHSHIDGHSK